VSIVAWIVLGLVGGAVAELAFPSGSAQRGLVPSLVVGMLGAVIGGFLAAVLLGVDITMLDFTTLLVAGVGALSLILVVRAMPETDVFE
jgi:uncharacterized membrane protein YeaQ/YmgE (transglycosylase-associated protein family)